MQKSRGPDRWGVQKKNHNGDKKQVLSGTVKFVKGQSSAGVRKIWRRVGGGLRTQENCSGKKKIVPRRRAAFVIQRGDTAGGKESHAGGQLPGGSTNGTQVGKRQTAASRGCTNKGI